MRAYLFVFFKLYKPIAPHSFLRDRKTVETDFSVVSNCFGYTLLQRLLSDTEEARERMMELGNIVFVKFSHDEVMIECTQSSFLSVATWRFCSPLIQGQEASNSCWSSDRHDLKNKSSWSFTLTFCWFIDNSIRWSLSEGCYWSQSVSSVNIKHDASPFCFMFKDECPICGASSLSENWASVSCIRAV